jgi:cytochrome oxidase Cu insertion factor (SCO1/SenC/PrrC family)
MATDARERVVSEIGYEWQDEHGASTHLAEWHGRPFLLTMAYSTCRQVCSYTLHRLEELQNSADRAGTPIDILVVSYDPTVDGPASWTAYRRHHDLKRTNWHFLTGSPADTEAFAAALAFPHWRYDEHVVHDFQILLIGADGHVSRALNWANRNDDFFTAAISCSPPDTRGCKQ